VVIIKTIFEGSSHVTWFDTVLSVVATDGQYEWAKFCLENGTDPSYPRPVDEYKSILAGAAEKGKVDVVELLLAHGARLRGSGAIVAAAEEGEVESVKFLLGREDLDIDELGIEHPTNRRGTKDMGTALHHAVRRGHREIVELLVERGANVDLEDVQGRTALMLAKENERSEIVDFLTRITGK
jgi:ankyrin repeat protein